MSDNKISTGDDTMKHLISSVTTLAKAREKACAEKRNIENQIVRKIAYAIYDACKALGIPNTEEFDGLSFVAIYRFKWKGNEWCDKKTWLT